MAEPPTPPSPLIFDRRLLRARHRRAASLGPATFLLDRVADDITDRLATVKRRFDLALDLGTPGEAVRAALARVGSVGTIVAAAAFPAGGAGRVTPFVIADEEASLFLGVPARVPALDTAVRWHPGLDMGHLARHATKQARLDHGWVGSTQIVVGFAQMPKPPATSSWASAGASRSSTCSSVPSPFC